jgi:hypothetical protein
MSWKSDSIILRTKGKNMCNICYAQANQISMISSSPETMCDDHYFEWANEKACAELDMMEDYYHMI